MPVRKIPKSFRSVTGRFPSVINGRCVGYESKLERDFFLRLEFDQTVESYEEQPLRLTGLAGDREVSYTPDCLVRYRDGKPDRIVEVKYQSELEEKAKEFEPRFALARNHARLNGLEFVIATDADIYDGAIDNYRLIYRFSKPPNNLLSKKKPIFEALGHAEGRCLSDLLQSLGADRHIQAEYTPSIWHLIFAGEIQADLTMPIDYRTIMRLSNGKDSFV